MRYASADAIEPAFLADDDVPGGVLDLAQAVAEEGPRVGSGLPLRILRTLTGLVRISDACRSLSIEGIDASPEDVMAILEGDAGPEAALLAARHVAAREEIEVALNVGLAASPLDKAFLSRIHARLLAGSTDPDVVPGALRTASQRVRVGRHEPPDGDQVTMFLERLRGRSRMATGSPERTALVVAAAHHRLAWIHPFVDGNGRTVRLATATMLASSGIDAASLLSVSRALGGADGDGADYKRMLAVADRDRQGSRDGRGSLSTAGLVGFVEWFLSSLLAEIRHAAVACDPDRLLKAVVEHAVALSGTGAGGSLAAAAFAKGVVAGDEAGRIVGEAPGRSPVASALVDGGLLARSVDGSLQLRLGPGTWDAVLPGVMPDGVRTTGARDGPPTYFAMA